MSDLPLTAVAAWVGVAGFLLAAAKWITDLLKDRAKLSVELRATRLLIAIGDGPLTPSSTRHFNFKAVNRGGKPIQICSMGVDLIEDFGGLAQGEFRPPKGMLPKTIDPEMSETFAVDIPAEEFLDRLASAWLEDSRGRRWHAKPKDLRLAVEGAKSWIAEEP